jgi:tetratricopeptide (TPR) repeat protein
MYFHNQQSEIAMKTDSYKYFVVCVISLSILFFALPAFAQSGALEIKCVDSSGAAIQGARVVIINMAVQKEKDKKTDADGFAEFTKLDDGTYRIVGRKDGYAPALYEFAVLKGTKDTIPLKLSPGADKKFYFEDPAEGQQAVALLKQGMTVLGQNNAAEAEKALVQSLEINPSNPVGLYYLAVANLQQSKYDQLVPMLNRAIQMAETMKGLPALEASLPTYDQVSQGASKLLKQIPAFKGDDAARKKDYNRAIVEYSEAIKNSPDNPEYQASMAIALANANRYDEAVAAIDKAIQLRPDDKTYADNKARIVAKKESATLAKAQSIMEEGMKLLKSGEAAEAIKKFEEAKGMIPEAKQAPLWLQIGEAQAKLGDKEAAIAAFKKALEFAPVDKAEIYRKAYAQFYLDERKYDEAIAILADAKAAGQTPEQVLQDLVKTWKDKEPNFAMAALEKIIQMNPDNADAYFDLGQLCYMDGKSKDARTKELLTKYLEIGKDPTKIGQAKDMMVIVNKRSSK